MCCGPAPAQDGDAVAAADAPARPPELKDLRPKLAAFFESSPRYGKIRPLLKEAAARYRVDYELLQALVATESDRARLAGLRFERGVSSYLDVLDAQRALFTAEQALVQLRRAHMASTVNLYKALGGGAVIGVVEIFASMVARRALI